MENLLSSKLEYFSELLTCGQQLWMWEYDTTLQPVQTNCPMRETFEAYFSLSVCYAHLYSHIEKNLPSPLIMSDEVGFSWIAAFEQSEGYTTRVHMIGPCFLSDISSQKISQKLSNYSSLRSVTKAFEIQIRELPIIPVTTWFQMGLMLHFTVTGEKITISDFTYPSEETVPGEKEETNFQKAGSGTWIAEQDAMRMIEEGRLDYKNAMGQLSMSAGFASPGDIIGDDRKLKNAVLSFITLCTRAAIRGGLDVETAYHIGNTYIDGVESSRTLSELMRLNTTMYDDFIRRVHKIKTASGISPAVQSCCNYIEFHISEPLTLASIAKDTGYAELYLAQKFKKEIGIPVTKYIQKQRVEKAKRLLKDTPKSIVEISEELGFCNSSYFSKIFREVTGSTPAQWKESKA